jgi:hypothetical protein
MVYPSLMDQAAGSGAPETLEEHLARGGDRRSFIKKMAVAGTTAWVVPIVAGSFVSPAMASGATGLSLQYSKQDNGNATCIAAVLTTVGGGTCDPAGFTSGQNTTANAVSLGVSGASCASASASFTVGGGHSISAGIRCSGTISTPGVLSNGNQTITWGTASSKGDIFRLVAT